MLDGVGAALCLFSAACFGAMAVFGKLAYQSGVSPETLLLVRFALAAAVLATILLLRPGLRRPTRARRRDLVTAVGLGAAGYAVQASLYFAALQRMDAALLSLILYTYPVLVTVGAALLGRDRLTPARCAALVTASCGTLLVLAGGGGLTFHPVGTLLAFGSAVTYTAYILVADPVVHRLPPVVLTALVMTGATGTLGIRALVTGGVDLGVRPAGWLWLACIALVSTVLAILAFFAGLRRTGPSTAAIVSTFEPVVTTALAALVLGESLTALRVAGGILVLASVPLLQLRRRLRVEEGGEALQEHGAALDLGGLVGTDDGTRELAGAAARPEGQQDAGRVRHVGLELAGTGDEGGDVGGHQLALPAGDRGHVPVGVRDVPDREHPLLPDDPEVLVDPQVPVRVPGLGQRPAQVPGLE
jgi:drug/metabolite transporter (DMT)-like permease